MRGLLVSILVAAMMCASGILVAHMASDTALSIKNKGYVTVKGFVKEEIKSDLGIFEVSIVGEDANLETCYGKLAGDRGTMKSFLDQYDFPKEDTEIYPVEVKEKYKITDRGYDTHEFVNYKLSQNFRVESKDVEKIADLSAEIGDLLGKGVKVVVKDPQFVYTELEDLKVEMIGRAAANAKERAEIIAKEGKFKLGPIADVRVGIFQITPPHSTQISNYGINDTTSIDKEIKSVVEIKYFVK